MSYSDFEIAFSKPRIGRFLLAVRGDREKALMLYKYNIQLSQVLFGLLSIFEVTLRNHVDTYYRIHFNDREWLKNQCDSSGIFSHPSFAKYGFESKLKVLTALARLGKNYNHDRLVAELSFGFWTRMFASTQFRVGGQGLHKIYTDRYKGVSQRQIFNELNAIRGLRNRIAHHEPLCFDRHHNTHTNHTKTVYGYMIRQTIWLGYDPGKLYLSLDNTMAIIKTIEHGQS